MDKEHNNEENMPQKDWDTKNDQGEKSEEIGSLTEQESAEKNIISDSSPGSELKKSQDNDGKEKFVREQKSNIQEEATEPVAETNTKEEATEPVAETNIKEEATEPVAETNIKEEATEPVAE
ncbi:hypothetical protein IC620_13535, partial [Hazenella sp. IB182357]|nr:hypothetical protein [Polycladospora coralii]